MSQRPADNYVRMEAKQQIIITSATVDSPESEYFPHKWYTNKNVCILNFKFISND